VVWRRSGEVPTKVRRSSGEGPTAATAVRRRSGRGGGSSGDAEATTTKRKDTLSSDTVLRIKKIGIEINLPCI